MRLIDADELTKELKHITDAYGGDDGDAVFTYYDPLIRRNQLVNMEEFIKRCPTIDPVKHGKWEIENSTVSWTGADRPSKVLFKPATMECSICGWILGYYGGLEEELDFCPHCGAYMRGE